MNSGDFSPGEWITVCLFLVIAVVAIIILDVPILLNWINVIRQFWGV